MSPPAGALPPPDDLCVVSVKQVLERVGDKWSLYVVATLRASPLRFSELRRSIEGISQRMLTLTLRGLERDGLITRAVTPGASPRVDYQLSPVGRSLLAHVMRLVDWTVENMELITHAQATFDQRPRIATTPPGVRRIRSGSRPALRA